MHACTDGLWMMESDLLKRLDVHQYSEITSDLREKFSYLSFYKALLPSEAWNINLKDYLTKATAFFLVEKVEAIRNQALGVRHKFEATTTTPEWFHLKTYFRYKMAASYTPVNPAEFAQRARQAASNALNNPPWNNEIVENELREQVLMVRKGILLVREAHLQIITGCEELSKQVWHKGLEQVKASALAMQEVSDVNDLVIFSNYEEIESALEHILTGSLSAANVENKCLHFCGVYLWHASQKFRTTMEENYESIKAAVMDSAELFSATTNE